MEKIKKIKVKRINVVNNENVYDLKIKNNHNFFANNVLVHNCGEIFMHEDSCRLIHVNLSSFIIDEYTDNARVDDEKLYEVFYETTRLGDDLVDLEANAINRIMDKIKNDGDENGNEHKLYKRLLTNTLNGRRCGVGFFGLADAIAKLGLKFDSEESLKVIRNIMRIMFVAELDSEVDMAITRGAFPSYDKDLEMQGNDWYKMVESEFEHQFAKMMKYGRRNVSFGTAAPTGSVALLARCSSGIEPIFMPFYVRRVKCTTKEDRVDFIDKDGEKFTEYITVHPTLKEWAKTKFGNEINNWNQSEWKKAYESSPWHGSTANDIDWKKRVEIQGIIQERVSHSISSTINLPSNVTENEVSTIYMHSWKNGLKGVTVYRDGCRGGVFVSTDKKEDKKKNITKELIENNTAKKRPKTLEAKIIRFSNKGEKWVGIVGILDDEPYELFTGMLEKLNIPNWVESGFIIKNYDEIEVDGEVKKVSRYDLCYNDKDGYKVCIEGISRIFNPEFWNYGKLISGLLRHHMPIPYIVKVISSLKLDDSTINTWKNGVVRALRKFETASEVKGEKCPECGGRLMREGGCIHCIDCGYSKCS